ncbi:diguanylate cyclase [Vibrio mytili]|uniref:sensor domain-containing diguanylate cyclase n=1 Tax=Vibrio mytili TaxID=50718 RepID=UPI0039E81C9A
MTKPATRTYLPNKSLIQMIMWLLFVMVVTVFCCLAYFLSSLDSLAADQLSHRVFLAKDLETRSSKDLLEEYTFWDEAYEHVVKKTDKEWIKGNSGDYLLSKRDFDFSVAVVNGDQKAYLVTHPDAQNLQYEDIKAPLLELIQASEQMTTVTKLAHGIFKINGDVYYIVGGPFVDEMSELPHEGTYLALGKKFDPEYLIQLASDYQLYDLRLSDTSQGLEYFMALHTASGETVGFLSWQPDVPSKAIIPTITLIIIIFSVIIASIITYILKKQQLSRDEYESRLFQEATTDSLTKVKNRRYVMMMGNSEYNTFSQLESQLLSILVIDIDHFKAINDKYGHKVGDKALVHFTELCLAGLRKTDILGRIGGEEFAIILPNTDEQKAQDIANRIRILVSETPFYSDGIIINLTISVGVSVLHTQESFETLLEEADKALYEAKRSGRNKVMLYNQSNHNDV